MTSMLDGDECAYGGHYAEGAEVSSVMMPAQKFGSVETYVSFSLCERHSKQYEGMLPHRKEPYVAKLHVLERPVNSDAV